jgi:hypothetical protein
MSHFKTQQLSRSSPAPPSLAMAVAKGFISSIYPGHAIGLVANTVSCLTALQKTKDVLNTNQPPVQLQAHCDRRHLDTCSSCVSPLASGLVELKGRGPREGKMQRLPQ